jgi:dTDP-4-dehydrorhamnose reductase
MKKRVLICGNGYVGGYVFAQLSKNTSLDVTLESKATLDYTDEYYLHDYLKEQRFDYLINAQGYTGRPNVDAAERDKEACWKYNVQVPVMFNTVCRELHVQPIHITSGCIFTGYDKAWSEADEPNFGVYNSKASFYSTSKHAFESVSDNGITIRIRMPFCDTLNERSYLTKIHKYDDLISAVNSKTYIPELVDFIEQIIEDERKGHDVVHFTNPEPLETAGVVELMKEHGLENEDWSWVDLKDLNLAAGRSNCILDTTKLKEEYGFTMLTETEALRKALKAIAS